MESNYDVRQNEKNEKNKVKLHLEMALKKKVEIANIKYFNVDRKDVGRVRL
jgi:hypothetical protein